MKKLFVVILSIILVFAVCGGAFWYYHPTHYKFNDRFIIGNTKEKIIEKYGKPYRENSGITENVFLLEYKIKGNTSEIVMGYDDSLWYVIVFKDNKAEKVYLRKGNIGG